MKQFKHILEFEFMNYFKNKIFIGTTLAFVLIIGVVLFFPRITDLLQRDSTTEDQEQTDQEQLDQQGKFLLVDSFSENPELSLSSLQATLSNKTIELSNKSMDDLKLLIDSGEYESAIVLTAPTSYSYLVKDAKIQDNTQYLINEVLRTNYRLTSFEEQGISPEQANDILSTEIKSEVILTGKNQMENYFYTYILIMALYMAIIFYGQMVATNIASEKSSRAMELLITSAKPTNLIFGKVMGSALAGLFQITTLLGSSYLFFQLNKDYWTDSMIVNSIFNMPLSILLYTVLFFILGFLIYAFLYGAIGSFATKVEDINTSSMPITLLFLVAFMIIMFSMSSGNVDTPMMLIASYVPFTSPMAMFVRIAMSEVPTIEIIASVAILIVSTIGIGYFSAKIYRVGVLLYGTPPKFSTILKAMKNS